MLPKFSLDKLAIILSSVCLLHCLLAPLVITIFPLIVANSSIDHYTFHQLILWLALPTSIVALFIGCKKHRDIVILAFGALGLGILIFTAYWGHEWLGLTGERISTSIGGLSLAFSHWLNYQACQARICADNDCQTRHHH